MRSRLKYILLDKGIDQTVIAETFNKKPTYISRIARTETIPHVGFLYELAKFLKVNIEDLYDDWENY